MKKLEIKNNWTNIFIFNQEMLVKAHSCGVCFKGDACSFQVSSKSVNLRHRDYLPEDFQIYIRYIENNPHLLQIDRDMDERMMGREINKAAQERRRRISSLMSDHGFDYLEAIDEIENEQL